jgi:SAM-dependent methyltransferase
VARWYSSYIESPDTYQNQVVFPGVLRLLAPRPGATYLDIACGEGALAQRLAAAGARVVGLDAAPALVERARRRNIRGAEFLIGDARRFPDAFRARRFDGAVCVLAIQNIKELAAVFGEAAKVLSSGAPLVVVLNHPAFRIPRQSEWGWDENKKTLFRRLDRYLTPLDVPILMNPGQPGRRPITTMSYHRPLQEYFAALAGAGFAVDGLEEWVSHHESAPGKRAKAENRARLEFPLFLALRARKPA